MPGGPPTVFISYSRADSDFVDRLESSLQKCGFRTWRDLSKLEGGQNWPGEIEQAIDTCHVCFVVVSPKAMASEWVQNEYRYARQQGKLVIPLHHLPILKLPIDLISIQGVNFQGSYDQDFAHLLDTLRHHGITAPLPPKQPPDAEEGTVPRPSKPANDVTPPIPLTPAPSPPKAVRATSVPVDTTRTLPPRYDFIDGNFYNGASSGDPAKRAASIPKQREPAPLSSLPTPPPQVLTPQESGISRRGVLIGVGSLVGLAAVGSCIWLANTYGETKGSPTPTPNPSDPLYIYRGHSTDVFSVAWSPPDGTRIASASGDGTVQVWDASDGTNLYIYRGHTFQVHDAAWSPPDGTRIASASGDGTVQVWNASDGSHVYIYKSHSGPVNAASWSPDGIRIASGGGDDGAADFTVQVWNASDGSHVYTYNGHSGPVNAVAWSPDGKRIASASGDGTVQVWNASDGSHVYTYKGHSGPVNTVAWSPDGKRIASGGGDDGAADFTVQVWNASDGSRVYTYKGHSGPVYAVAWSPDGTRIASGSDDRTMQVWNASDGSQVHSYWDYITVLAVAWSPDGTRIASGSFDNAQIWRAP